MTTVHCTITKCRHNNEQAELCTAHDIIITEAGCLVHCQGVAAESRPHPANDGRETE